MKDVLLLTLFALQHHDQDKGTTGPEVLALGTNAALIAWCILVACSAISPLAYDNDGPRRCLILQSTWSGGLQNCSACVVVPLLCSDIRKTRSI